MSPKKTIRWFVIAGVLFGFIFFYQRHARPPAVSPAKVLPGLRPEAVTSLLIRPAGPSQLLIRVDRTNGTWQLSQPLLYPAQAQRVLKLLAFLQQLTPAPYISGSELRAHANADEEYGFASPQVTVVIQQGGYAPRLRVGALTNPGDQVFLQVEGDLGAYVVDAKLLEYLPRSANDWRDTTLLDLTNLAFDRIAVTNSSKGELGRGGLPASSSTFVLQRNSTNGLWRMVWPLDTRANQSRILGALTSLQQLRIRQFVSDDPKIDPEPFGLAPAELELGFSSGTNALALLQFGRGATNDVTEVYARHGGQAGTFAVDKDPLLAWCSFLNDFRDPHLLSLTNRVGSIEFVRGTDRSSVQHQPDGSWRILPGNYLADDESVQSVVSSLTNLAILKFVNDVANPADLPQYGLAPPLERLTLMSDCPVGGAPSNSVVLAELDFGLGTNGPDQVCVRRTDESFVYAISTNDFNRLPSGSWQLRERRLCPFGLADVAAVTLRSHGKTSRMLHKGALSWSFAPGSQGIINDAAIEETVRGITQVSAIVWVGRGRQSRAAFGFVDDGYHVVLERSNGESFDLEFGGEAPTGNLYAGVTLEGEFWILEFPWIMYRDIDAYLPLKPGR
ncbi:MAG TPA: DUF4340 domain-containing protein [Verrucomicrobiae bacterium]|nr:DUF4340 domain-containing protein [Verrucomicrobiae bacterium]